MHSHCNSNSIRHLEGVQQPFVRNYFFLVMVWDCNNMYKIEMCCNTFHFSCTSKDSLVSILFWYFMYRVRDSFFFRLLPSFRTHSIYACSSVPLWENKTKTRNLDSFFFRKESLKPFAKFKLLFLISNLVKFSSTPFFF